MTHTHGQGGSATEKYITMFTIMYNSFMYNKAGNNTIKSEN